MRTQINNFDAGRGYAHQIDQCLPAPDDTESSITPSKLLLLGIFIGCLAAAGFILFFMLSAGSASTAKPQTAQQEIGTLPDASGIIQSGDGQSQTGNKSRINKPHTDRSRSSQKVSGQNDYKSTTVVTSTGHAPKMLESQ